MKMKITSRDNQRLKNVRKIREGKIPEKIFVEGLRLAEETLRSNIRISEVFCTSDFGRNDREKHLIEQIEGKSVQIFEVEHKIFNSIADTQNSQGIVLIADKPQNSKSDFSVKNTTKTKHFLFLVEVNNPSNLGAILRTAEAAGISGVIISKKSADAFSPRALRASMGACLRLPIWENADFEEVLKWAKKNKLITTAADIYAKKSYSETDWSRMRLITLGSEANGLTENQRLKMDELIFIPMENSVESLNLAVACGIILFEAKKHGIS